MSTVRIPPVLRVSTGGLKLVEIGGTTVGEVLTTLVATHPGLGGQLFSADGDLNRFMNVFLNDTDIRHLQILATPVTEQDAIVLLPAMAGGCSSAGGGSMDQSPVTKDLLDDLCLRRPPRRQPGRTDRGRRIRSISKRTET